jgi:hypothetical protein
MRLLLTGEIDKKTAFTLIYALQTASSSLVRRIKPTKTKAEIQEEGYQRTVSSLEHVPSS